MIFWASPPGVAQTQPHAFVPETNGIEGGMYYISKYKRDNGKDAIPGPGARFSGPAHPGWPKFNLTRSGQRPAGWKEECIIFCVIRGITKPARSPVPVCDFLGWPTQGDPNSTSPVRTGDQRDRRKNILDFEVQEG